MADIYVVLIFYLSNILVGIANLRCWLQEGTIKIEFSVVISRSERFTLIYYSKTLTSLYM